jgi:transcription-repair coupling factor (superfamily II helicase)
MAEKLAGLLPEIENIKGFATALPGLEPDAVRRLKTSAALRPPLAAALFSAIAKPLVVVCPTMPAAEWFAAELTDYLPQDRVAVMPEWDSPPFEAGAPDVETIGRRAEVLERLGGGERLAVCMSAPAWLQKLPVPGEDVHRGLTLTSGQQADLDKLTRTFLELGYGRQPLVERPGEFAVRGSVVDIFPAQAAQPVRFDFFGDEIESIKWFDVADQRSTGPAPKTRINPCREFRIDEAALERIDRAGGPAGHDGELHRWLPAIHQLGAVQAYLPEAVWLIDEPKAVGDEARRLLSTVDQALSEDHDGRLPFSVADYYLDPEGDYAQLTPRVELTLTDASDLAVQIDSRRPEQIEGKFDRLETELNRLRGPDFRTVLVHHDQGELDRMSQLLGDMGFAFDRGAPALNGAGLSLVIGRTTSGYILPQRRLAVFGALDLWPRREILPPPARPRRQVLIDFSDLNHGDLLVHEIHGIAAFAGLVKRTMAGKAREYLMLDYAAGDRLYLPTDQLHRVSRYLGPEGVRPEITRLGGADWLRTTKKVRKSVKKLAVDLLALYAERAQHPGHSFPPDNEWQRGMEAAFPYEPTKDQAAAIAEVKQDMQAPKPMDRLVCGDVGYGKTEVALRAAFKAVLDGKQVMMLVPTTILAQQHYLTFKERFTPYPVRVEMLSRFLTTAQQKEIVERVRKGSTDMVVGTHRLLQKDIRFSNLGLIIVDEEHRFGVNHKEKLRRLRGSVDVIALSATPIPRTLQMSISGIRDLSLIETPPEGRHPVITHISQYEPGVLRSAIRRELSRRGQVFYVHNRVETIDNAAARVKQMVPEARVLVAHGQMSEGALEKVMLKFLQKEADVLVCTTIIESGIDISSANTLIIEDAERLGLAQLYQLRGRIGRSSVRGYAYLTYNPSRLLSETAMERLKTIGEFTELGSGYKVALRDLEIRGAGDVLGAEQHGHMINVGFDLYCRMLREEVDRLQGNWSPEPAEISLELPVEALLPETYIDDENLRLETYRSIAAVSSMDELESIGQELADRFGRPPKPVAALLGVAELRLKAAEAGVTAVSLKNRRLVIKGQSGRFADLGGRYDLKIKPGADETILTIPHDNRSILKFIIDIFNAIMP